MINKDTEMFTTVPRKCEFEPNLRFDYILLVAITETGKKFIDFQADCEQLLFFYRFVLLKFF